jgi:hypothetical protein
MQQLTADTLDDLLLMVYPKILRNGQRVKASKGWNKELFGVVLELKNPLARLSRSETKGTVFSCLGETLWYLAGSAARAVLVEQIVESLRRIEFVHVVRDGEIDPRRADPASHLFDPIRAAAFWMRKGELDEAFWLVFLSTHFGKHVKYGWGLTRAVYGGSNGQTWTWKRVSRNVGEFRRWLSQNEVALKQRYAFSNHRKYQSLSAYSKVGTGAVVESYVKWVAPPRTHLQMIQELHKKVGQDPRAVFDSVYQSMDLVMGFGRLGKFDYLTMLGKLGVAPIEPGSAYLVGATGPLQGARLLFANNPKAKLNLSSAGLPYLLRHQPDSVA